MESVELEIAVDAGLSIGQLAERFGCSKGQRPVLVGQVRAEDAEPDRPEFQSGCFVSASGWPQDGGHKCSVHGVTDFVLDTEGYFRCRACRATAVSKRRRRVKQTLIEEAGGCCQLCGYCRYQGALAFHHVDPQTETMTIAAGITLAIETLRDETRKCVLLCHNCHAEVEAGLRDVSLH